MIAAAASATGWPSIIPAAREAGHFSTSCRPTTCGTGLTRDLAIQTFHWTFLAQHAPWPEEIIGRDPVGWLDHKLGRWGGTGDLSLFAPEALAHYRAFFSEPARIHATCEDYRAGAGYDLAADEADRAARPPDCLPDGGILGREGHPEQDRQPARYLGRMVRPRRGPRHPVRPFPARGKRRRRHSPAPSWTF